MKIKSSKTTKRGVEISSALTGTVRLRHLMKTIPHSVLVVSFATLIVSGCGERGQTDGRPADATPAPGADKVAEKVSRDIAAFVPKADQFGIRRFKIVYQLKGQETGVRTMWVEDYGARVGIEENLTTYGQRKKSLYYWDGERSYMKDLPDGKLFTTPIRTKISEPTSFATLPANAIEQAGYKRVGEKTIVGKTCEHWKNDQFNFEGSRWNNIEFEFLNGAGTQKIIQRSVASEFVEGEGIPDRITALAH